MNSKFRTTISAIVLSSAAASTALAAAIDAELTQQIDFRSADFADCLDQEECSVSGLTIRAERRDDQTSPWLTANLYWDPIDGLGVQNGAQNDEIDIDERIVVTFNDPVTVKRVWLSDLFVSEDSRYGTFGADRLLPELPADTEVAGVSLFDGELELTSLAINGEDRLPWASFNQEVDVRFRENGDLRRRIIVNDDTIRVMIPGDDLFLTAPTRPLEQDQDKENNLFAGLETVELDITDLLKEFSGSPVFGVGSRNFEIIKAVSEDPENIARILQIAQQKRDTIRMSNGEVGHDVDFELKVTSVSFFAPFSASNDFSVAGIVVE
ncbi:hypothetical protein [Cognatishimia activa]|uniref:DUF2125 domain-containing protein n=1 Tax=Cognatishimia activa TaxID=1715691 RepID=A0A0P1IVS0_9RHOB|nr:hypothetical protein [Cognatishimia activa]CUJ18002.1 hypothetical protein TA5113_02550 [Cognatishimia activa]CUK27583.1 hypothetical protein TA5114_03411 [Cognatishimia activa]